jgi:hypothetical protein
MPKTDIKVKLIGENGNAFHIIGKVMKALKRAGYHKLAKEYQVEATSGDYNHVLITTMDYIEITGCTCDCEDYY